MTTKAIVKKFKPINGYTRAKIIQAIEDNMMNHPAVNVTESGEFNCCTYLAADGNKCAVGIFLPAGHLSQKSRENVRGIMMTYPDLATILPLPLAALEKLQNLHDSVAHSETPNADPRPKLIAWVKENVKTVKYTISKRKVIVAIMSEPLNAGAFFSNNADKACKVCAVGSILRAVGAPQDDQLASKACRGLYAQSDGPELQNALDASNWLGALSVYHENLANKKCKSGKKRVLGLKHRMKLVRFVLKNFPAKITFVGE